MRKALWEGSKTFSKLLHIPMIILASVIFWLLLVSTSSSGKKVDLKETLTVDRKESEGLIKDGDKLISTAFPWQRKREIKASFFPRDGIY